jgi:hypothetical protein
MEEYKTIQQIKEGIKDEVIAGYKLILSQKAEYEIFMASIGVTFKEELNVDTPTHFNSTDTEDRKVTFDSIVIDILENSNEPARTIDLIVSIKDKTGKDYDRKTVGSRLSTSAKKNKFKIYELGVKDSQMNFWWTLPSWWEGESLKPDYIKAIELKKEKALKSAS